MAWRDIHPGAQISARRLNELADAAEERVVVAGGAGVTRVPGGQIVSPGGRVRLNARITGASSGFYSWVESYWDADDEDWADVPGGQSGSTSVNFAVERNGASVANDTIVELELEPSGLAYVFSHPEAGAAAAFSGARVYLGSNQSISNNTSTGVAFDNEVSDTNAFHDNATNNTRLTIPSDGNYIIGATVLFDVNTTGYREVKIRKGGLVNHFAISRTQSHATEYTTINLSGLATNCSAGDYFEIMALQNSGGSLNLIAAGSSGTQAWICKVG